MRFLIQSVESASVTITEFPETESKSLEMTRSIGGGILLYFGVSINDVSDYIQKIHKFIKKVGITRMLKDQNGRIDATLNDIKGEILVISNFTLYGNNKKGNKMSFTESAPFEEAQKIYEFLLDELIKAGYTIQHGEFGAMMDIQSVNSGPLNYIWDY